MMAQRQKREARGVSDTPSPNWTLSSLYTIALSTISTFPMYCICSTLLSFPPKLVCRLSAAILKIPHSHATGTYTYLLLDEPLPRIVGLDFSRSLITDPT